MIQAQPTLFTHPNVLAVVEIVAVVVAFVAVWWAGRRVRAEHAEVQRRLNKVELQVGLMSVCNPGRRGTDRCLWCQNDAHCQLRAPDPPTIEQEEQPPS